MSTTIEQIDLWRASRSEHQRLEFKEARQDYNRTKLGEYCVAIANEGGGHLILGVSDKPPREVVGSVAFEDTLETAQWLFQKLGFRVDIEAVPHPNGRVVVFLRIWSETTSRGRSTDASSVRTYARTRRPSYTRQNGKLFWTRSLSRRARAAPPITLMADI